MLYLDLDARNGGSLSGVRCPTCGSRGGMRYHASYRRFVVDLAPSGLPAESTVWVDRARCGACGATHALLPTSLVAYSPLTVRMCLAVLSCCLDASRGPAEARRRFLVCRRTCERLANDAPRLAATLACAMWGLAGELALAADDPSFPPLFASQHGTTPFSRVRLAKWAPAGRAGQPPPHRPTR